MNSRSRETVEELWKTIEFLNCQLEARMPQKHPPQMTGEVQADMVAWIKAGNIIQACKVHRAAFKSTLKEAVDAMRELQTRVNKGEFGEVR